MVTVQEFPPLTTTDPLWPVQHFSKSESRGPRSCPDTTVKRGTSGCSFKANACGKPQHALVLWSPRPAPPPRTYTWTCTSYRALKQPLHGCAQKATFCRAEVKGHGAFRVCWWGKGGLSWPFVSTLTTWMKLFIRVTLLQPGKASRTAKEISSNGVLNTSRGR